MNENLSDISSKKGKWYTLVIIWFSCVLLFFSPAVFQNKAIAPIDCIENFLLPFANGPVEEVYNHYGSDAVSQYLPYRWAMKNSFEQDGYIGWNPYTHNGSAIPENSMLSPGDFSHYLYSFLSFYDAWNWSIILHFFIAGCGMLLLLRYFKVPMWGALLAAISFSFYAQFITCIYFRWMGSMIWAPFLVWALIKYKQYTVNVPAIVFMALAWRTGNLQACLFVFVLVALVWCAEVTSKIDGKYNFKESARLTLSYFITGVVGALLALDVFVETLPRMEGCKSVSLSWGFNNVASYITAIFPTCLGTPHTIDMANAFGLGFGDVKFGGSLVFILSLIACFNKRAPRVAKFIFIISMLLVCTPLNTYLYSRSTVIMALGMAWLAAWQLYDFTQHSFNSTYWKRIAYCVSVVLVGWLIASIVITCFKGQITDILTNVMTAKISGGQLGREGWYLIRFERWFSQIVIWDWRNLSLSACLLLGIFFCYRIKPGNKNKPWIVGVVVLTFTELLLFSQIWLTYSNRPTGQDLYQCPAWMPELKSHVKNGSLAVHQPIRDKRFLCTNHFSSFGVRLADGYETIQPQYIKPHKRLAYDTKEYAAAGISHIISQTTWKQQHIPNWRLVMSEKDFNLYANPDYKGRYLINDSTPITENWRTYNRIHLTIPPNTENLTVLESYHEGWKAYANNQELLITPTERGGMLISVPSSAQACDLLLEFRMPYRTWCYSLMMITALGLGAVLLCRKKSSSPSTAQ